MVVSRSRSRSLSFCFVLLLLSWTLARGAWAQAGLGNGRLEGQTTDSSGAAIPGATVAAKDQATGISFQRSTSADGNFIFVALPPGSYEVTIEKQGFKKTVIRDVAVHVGTTSTIRPQLAVGTAETVIVFRQKPRLWTAPNLQSAA